MSEQPVTRAELARLTSLSVSTIDKRRRQGMPHVLYGKRTPRFFLSICLPWLAQFGRNQRQAGCAGVMPDGTVDATTGRIPVRHSTEGSSNG